MKNTTKSIIFLLLLGLSGYLFTPCSFSANKVVNVYVWGGEIPKTVVRQFEKDTGIQVNFSTYDNNETMYAKLKASRQGIYDVVMPSSYFIERMKKQGLLTKLDFKKLPNHTNIDPFFKNNDYDPGNQFGAPINWGITGIFYNVNHAPFTPLSWHDLWNKSWKRQLMLLDDSREIFSLALLSLGFLPNDENPEHIEKAYHALLKLIPNIKLFASDSVQAIIIDEESTAGTAWNGDAFKARQETDAIQFVYPKEGFVIWVDCLAIPLNAPHPTEAYEFINYMLKPNIAVEIALQEGHASANAKGKALLPKSIQNNPVAYPPAKILKNGHFQRDISNKTLALYNQYWERFKLAF